MTDLTGGSDLDGGVATLYAPAPGAALKTVEPADTDVAAREAFTAVYRSSVREVYAYLYNRAGAVKSVAEDLTQETFLAAVRAFDSGKGDTVSLPWLIGVARHKIVDHYRARERDERRLALVANERPPRAAELADEPVSRDRVMAALEGVPSSQRAALVLRYLDDLPVPEVARNLGRSIHATESLLARGRDNFRRRYSEAEHG